MDYNKIIERINLAIANLEHPNFTSNFPIVIDDLKYIYIDLDNEIEKMDEVEQFEHSSEIEAKLMQYFAKLTQKYIETTHNTKINIECTDDYSFATVVGGYDNKADKIKYSTFGMTLGRKNRSSYFQTFLHESRHKMQYDAYRTNSIDEILNFKGNSILLLKDKIYESLMPKDNRQFYQNNYNFLYTETDAENYSLELLSGFVMDMYFNYIGFITNSDQIDEQLITKMLKVHRKVSQDKLELEYNQTQSGRLNFTIIEELNGKKIISSSYNIQTIEVDKLIELDKTIKNHPELQEQMPLLKLLFNGDRPKTYNEIIEDRKKLLILYPQKADKINELYNSIINTDPILYLTDLVIKNESILIEEFIIIHPTLFEEYPKEIEEISSLSSNPVILSLLTNKSKIKK